MFSRARGCEEETFYSEFDNLLILGRRSAEEAPDAAMMSRSLKFLCVENGVELGEERKNVCGCVCVV